MHATRQHDLHIQRTLNALHLAQTQFMFVSFFFFSLFFFFCAKALKSQV